MKSIIRFAGAPAALFFYKLKPDDPLAKDWNIIEPFGKKLQNIRIMDEKQVEELTTKDMKKSPLLEGFAYTKKKSEYLFFEAGQQNQL